MRHILWTIAAALMLANPAFAQASLGTWNILNLRYNLSERWSLFAEPQLRSLRFYDHFHYYEFKGGLQYTLDKNFSVGFGIGNYHTYQEGGDFVTPKLNDELRTWAQVQMRQYLRRLKFEHRYRAEQRWTSSGFRHRFRYRLLMAIPIGRESVDAGAYYLAFANEIFCTNKAPFFERNRFFVGAGKRLNEILALQSGWLYQFDYRLTDEIGRHFFQISFLFDFESARRKKEFVPNTVN